MFKIFFNSDLESIKEQAIWLDDAQKYKLPELIYHRTKLPPAGKKFYLDYFKTIHKF